MSTTDSGSSPLLDAALLGAAGCAYFVNATTGAYDASSDPNGYLPLIGWSSSYVPAVSADTSGAKIDAAIVGLADIGIVVAFRGTLFDQPGEVEDWFQDLLADTVSVSGITGKVHYGFNHAVQNIIASVITNVKALVSANPGKAVYLTGHSKGGGMTPIAACLMQNAGIDITQIITFAAPKSGDSTFESNYDNTLFPGIHTRYENYGDIAPFLAPNSAVIGSIQDALKLCGQVGIDLANLLNGADKWDYEEVGGECYICAASDDYDLWCTPAYSQAEIDVKQTGGLLWNLGANLSDIGTALMHAHTLDKGYGYMTGVLDNNTSTSDSTTTTSTSDSAAMTATTAA